MFIKHVIFPPVLQDPLEPKQGLVALVKNILLNNKTHPTVTSTSHQTLKQEV